MPESMDTVKGLETAPGDSSGFFAMVAYMLPSSGPNVWFTSSVTAKKKLN